MRGYIIGLLGTWLFSDSIYSYILYVNAASYDGKRQTWARDHWIRAVRASIGITLIIIGGLNV